MLLFYWLDLIPTAQPTAKEDWKCSLGEYSGRKENVLGKLVLIDSNTVNKRW